MFVAAGRPLYGPLACLLALDLTNDTELLAGMSVLSSVALSGGDFHQLSLDELNEEMQRAAKCAAPSRVAHMVLCSCSSCAN